MKATAGTSAEARHGSSRPDGVWRDLWLRIAPAQRRELLITWLMGSVWSICAVAIPYIAGEAVDYLHRGRGVGSVTLICCMIGGIAIGKALALRVRRYLISVTSARIAGGLRERLFTSLHTRDAAFFDHTPLAEIFSALADDAEYIEQFGVSAQVLFNNIVWTSMIVAVLLVIDPLLAVMALAPLPLVLILALRFLKVAAPVNQTMRQDSVQLVDLASDAVTGMTVIKGLGIERRFIARLTAAATRTGENAMAAGRIRAKYTALIELIPTFSIVIVLLFGLEQVRGGHLTLGGFTAFIAYIVMAVWPLRFTANSIAGATRARLAVTRITGLENDGQQVSVAADLEPVHASREAAIDLRGVSFGYAVGDAVLNDVDLHVQAGEVIAVTGATGSGKTTLLRLISGELNPFTGTVQIGGVDLRTIRSEQRAALSSLVSHDEFLFSRSISENLAFPKPGADQEALERAAELAIFADVIATLDERWETIVGERAVRLSGGQRQRAALARGIVSSAGVLLLDDVTSALDVETRAALAAAMPRIRTGRTVVLVTAEPALLDAADRVVYIHAGALDAA